MIRYGKYLFVKLKYVIRFGHSAGPKEGCRHNAVIPSERG